MYRYYGRAVSLLFLIIVLVPLCAEGATLRAGEGRKAASQKATKAAVRGSNAAEAVRPHGRLSLCSASALVQDQQTGALLVEKQATMIVPIASITKLMTAMVVIDSRPNLQDTITIEQQDVDIIRHSRSHLPVGTRLTRADALRLALMASENRAAHALGRTYPGGLVACVAAMNRKARSLGLANTRFVDPAGLCSGNVSTAFELARMADAAYRYPLIREFSTCEEASIQTGRYVRTFRNVNRLVRSRNWQIGLSKTGFINEAGRCLVMQANVAKRPVLIVLLDAQGTLTRFGDANRIRQWMEGGQPPHRWRG